MLGTLSLRETYTHVGGGVAALRLRRTNMPFRTSSKPLLRKQSRHHVYMLINVHLVFKVSWPSVHDARHTSPGSSFLELS